MGERYLSSAAAGGTFPVIHFNSVAATFLGTVQGAIGGANHLVDIAIPGARFGYPNTDCNRNLLRA
jgi:hypothetical protein